MLVRKVKDNLLEILLLSILFVLVVALRFPNLGYSDYIGDEHKAFIQPGVNQSNWDFFMEQRKGPMQFLVSYIPYLFTQDWRNEFAERIPFTVFGTLSIFVFYAFLRKLTKNKYIAFTAAMLLSLNGFIIGFARIAQYQNLNLFFSFLALYFYTDFLRPSDKLLRSTLLGTAAFCLSILSHWDAIFVLIPILYFFVSFLRNKEITKEIKQKIVKQNFILGMVLLLPFLLPYVYNQFINEANKDYFVRRVSTGGLSFERYDFLFKLYNPFLVFEFLVFFATVSFVFIRKTWVYVLWFVVNYGIFEIFVRKPGTHIYNFVVPLIILASIGMVYLFEKLPKLIRYLGAFFVLAFFVFFTYQANVIYVDHTIEYPWSQETLFKDICEPTHNAKGELTSCGKFISYFTTPEILYDDKAPLFGFPLYRHWDEINAYINTLNRLNNEDFGYITNEVKTISEWYMDADYDGGGDFYIIGVKKPLSFVKDWKFPQISGKRSIMSFENNGEEVVRIYRVEAKNE